MSDTPETDEQARGTIGFYSCATVPADFARRLERERNETLERMMEATVERERWKMRAEEKWSMRRQLEELLGVEGTEHEEQFAAGVAALRKLISERDEARLQYGTTLVFCQSLVKARMGEMEGAE